MTKRPRKPKPDATNPRSWVEAINRGSIYSRPTTGDKGIVDRSTVGDFADAFGALFSVELTDIREGDDPPDVIARIGKRIVSIELSEFLNPRVREKRAAAMLAGVSYDGDEFAEAQWTSSTFLSRLNDLLDQKASQYSKRPADFSIDALVIHADESWLEWRKVGEWLSEATIGPRPRLKSAYILMSYDPTFSSEHCPLFVLYGDLAKG